MQKRQIIINAGMSVVQILIVTGTFLFLYRFLLGTIGVEGLGIWSLVLASTFITQFANMGISGGVVKFVAKYFARGEQDNLYGVIRTGWLSLVAIAGGAMIFAYPCGVYGLSYVMPATRLPAALEILPYALIALWITMTGSVFQASLEGLQRNDLGSLAQVTGTLTYLFLCLFMVGGLGWGLVGLAWARVCLSVFQTFLNYYLLKRCLPSFSFFPLRWEKRLFKEMIGYSVNFQVMSISAMLYDPVTKGLLSKFGGLSMVGYYEMAARMINQLRSIIISANGVIVPVVAEFQEKSPERVNPLYLTSYQILVYLALPVYSLAIICLPFISRIWIGHYEPIFIIFGTLLACGWFLNTLNGPAYFTYLGTGELRWSVISHIATAVLNPFLGILLGTYYGGVGVVVGWVCALALGSSIIYLSFHLKYDIPLRELMPQSSRLLAGVCVLGSLSTIMVRSRLNPAVELNPLIFMLLGFTCLVAISMWFHPIRQKLFAHLGDVLRSRTGRNHEGDGQGLNDISAEKEIS